MPGLWRPWIVRGWPAGVLVTSPLWWLWWTILVTGSPGSLTWMLIGIVLGSVGLATWWWLAVAPPDDSRIHGLAPWILLGEALVLCVILTSFWLFRLAIVSPPYALVYAGYAGLIVLAGTAWLRYPRRQPIAPWRGWHIRNRLRQHRTEGIALLVALLVLLALAALVPILIPYPALVSAALLLLVGALVALIAGVVTTRSPDWARWPSQPLLTAISYPLLVNFLVLALFGGNLLPAWWMVQGTGNLAEANGLAASTLPNLAAAASGRSVASADITSGILDVMTGQDRSARRILEAARWWAPASRHLLPADAWIGLWVPGHPAFSTSVEALTRLQDPGVVDTLMGIWATQQHQDARSWFFSALATTPMDLFELPASIPHPGITGVGSQAALASRLRQWSAAARAGIVAQLDANQAWTAALAADALLRGLVSEAPGGGSDLPSQWLSVAAAAWHVDNMPLAVRASIAAWQETHTPATRVAAAQVALEAASMPGYLESVPPGSTPGFQAIRSWAARQPPSGLTLDLVLWEVQGTQGLPGAPNWPIVLPTVLSQLQRVERTPLPPGERGSAWAIEATIAEASGHWKLASAAAQRAIRSRNRSAQAIGWMMAATVLLNTEGVRQASLIRHDFHRALADDPQQFMAWFSLATVDNAVGRKGPAAHADLEAIQERNRVVASGQGVYAVTVGSQTEGGSLWPMGTGQWGLPNLVNTLQGLAGSLAGPALKVHP